MKFKILVSNGEREWWEDYDEDIPNAQLWAEETIKNFNACLRPKEKPRTLLKVEVLDASNEKFHKWVKRPHSQSIMFRGNIVDLMYCERCGITGKRYGLNGYVVIDSKFRKKAFQRCDTAREELRKRKNNVSLHQDI